MILNQFRTWAQTASPSSRADGASALARAYLYSDLDAAQRLDAVNVLTGFLDDAYPLVRRAIAEAFASAVEAPHHIVLALADDQSSVAAIVLARSPVLSDAELIDCAASADAFAQSAIASRPTLSAPVAAALAEIALPEALVVLAGNHAAPVPAFSIRRIVERHGDDAALREALLGRPDLPPCVRLELVGATARALAAFVTGRNWMSDERMTRVAREERDKAAIVIADGDRGSARELVAHLRQAGHLTVGFAFRAILSGKTDLFKATLCELSGVPMMRVDGLTAQCDSAGFAALYRKADLPLELLPAFRMALHAVRETDWTTGARLSRRVIERVLTGCVAINAGELDKLLALLRRFEAEAAREDVRSEARGPLSLVSREEAPPLLLTDLDAPGYAMPTLHARARHVARREPTLFTIDMAAIEAELEAA